MDEEEYRARARLGLVPPNCPRHGFPHTFPCFLFDIGTWVIPGSVAIGVSSVIGLLIFHLATR